jgi:hypothetical protein
MDLHNARVESVARAFCTNDKRDPEEIVELEAPFFPGGGYTKRGSGLTLVAHGPQWQKYWKRAEPYVLADWALAPLRTS